MNFTILTVFAASSVVLAISLVLIFHHEYHDGLVRRIGLALIGLAAWLRVLDLLQSGLEHRPFSKMAILVWVGMAIFLADHFYNFLKHLWASRKKARRATDRVEAQSNGALSR